MDILIDSDESFAPHLDTWSWGLLPMPWLQRYVEPIVVLAGDCPKRIVRRELDRLVSKASEKIREAIRERFDIAPPLPQVRVEVVRGSLQDWRAGAAHFLAARCNGCFEVFPTYWTQTWEDRDLALAMERVHPVIPFLDRQVSAFKGLDFAGCFCPWCDTRDFLNDGSDENELPLQFEVNQDARQNRTTA